MTRAQPIVRDRATTDLIIVGHQRAHRSPSASRAITHTHAALAFLTAGQMRLELNGEWTLKAGDVLLVPPGAAHRTLDGEHPAAWTLGFCLPCVAAEGASSLLAPFDRVRNGAAAVVSIAPERRPFLESLFRELERLKPADSHQAVQRSLLTLILAEVERATVRGGPEHRLSRGSGVVADALRFIERRCLGRITPRDVAVAVKRTPAHLTTALKRATGRSAGEWIISGRMAEARRLLVHSSARVDSIAERVGYADVTHFIRMFRRAHGATPSAWRAAQSPRS